MKTKTAQIRALTRVEEYRDERVDDSHKNWVKWTVKPPTSRSRPATLQDFREGSLWAQHLVWSTPVDSLEDLSTFTWQWIWDAKAERALGDRDFVVVEGWYQEPKLSVGKRSVELYRI